MARNLGKDARVTQRMKKMTKKAAPMNYESARDYLLGKPEAELDYPFGPDVAVPKICGKMFATLGEETENGKRVGHMNLKCDPVEAEFLRDMFESVLPGYHMNKVHWNTIVLDGTIPNGEIERMIDSSYALVVKRLKKAERVKLEVRYGKAALYPSEQEN